VTEIITGEYIMAAFMPVQLRAGDLEIVSSARLSPFEVARLTQLESLQVDRIARREFRIDEIVLLYRSDLASIRAAESPEAT
jgi:hypothetical protein